MKRIAHKIRTLYFVLIGQSITILKKNNEFEVDAGNHSTGYIREVASEFFKTAYLLNNTKKL